MRRHDVLSVTRQLSDIEPYPPIKYILFYALRYDIPTIVRRSAAQKINLKVEKVTSESDRSWESVADIACSRTPYDTRYCDTDCTPINANLMNSKSRGYYSCRN